VFRKEGCLRGRRRFVKEEGCSIRMTHKLVEQRGQWRRTNKFVKKVVREEECDLRGRRLFATKAICEGIRLFDRND
jgi:hypothetical protein